MERLIVSRLRQPQKRAVDGFAEVAALGQSDPVVFGAEEAVEQVGSSPALFALPVVAVVAYVVIALLLYVLR